MTYGRFVTFEGGEGAGKSTQAALLARRLESLGIGVVQTREPGGSPAAEILRKVVLSGTVKALGPDLETLLFAAARADHVDTVVGPALHSGTWVICDRFTDSTRVYQGTVGGVDPRFIRGLERATVGDVRPDITFVLDLPASVGLTRAKQRRGGEQPDRFETESVAFHRSLNSAFRALAKAEPQRCLLINADRDKGAVADDIWAAVQERLRPGVAVAPEVAT